VQVIAPLLHENTRQKINILGKDHKAVLDVIDASCLPVRYGGTDDMALGEAPEEVDFRAYLDDVLRGKVGWEGGDEEEGGKTTTAVVAAGCGSGGNNGGGGGGGGEGGGGLPTAAAAPTPAAAPPAAAPAPQPASSMWGARLVGVGQRVAGGMVGGFKALRPAFLTPLSDAQKANLGRENRFVYDEGRRQWILIEEEPEEEEVDEEEEVEAEEEERLVRAIQAAHEVGGRSSSIRGRLAAVLRGGGGKEGARNNADAVAAATAAQARNVEELEAGRKEEEEEEEEEEGGGEEEEEGENKASAAAAIVEGEEVESIVEDREELARTRSGSILLLLLVAWRALALSLLLVLPLWLADQHGSAPYEIALLLFCGGIVATALWALIERTHLLPPFPTCLATLASLAVACLLLGPLSSSSSRHPEAYREAAGRGLSVVIAAFAVLMMGGSVSWAVLLSMALFGKEEKGARDDLLPSLLLADVLGAVLGPVIYSASISYGVEEGGEATWVSVVGWVGVGSVLLVGGLGKSLPRPMMTTEGGR